MTKSVSDKKSHIINEFLRYAKKSRLKNNDLFEFGKFLNTFYPERVEEIGVIWDERMNSDDSEDFKKVIPVFETNEALKAGYSFDSSAITYNPKIGPVYSSIDTSLILKIANSIDLEKFEGRERSQYVKSIIEWWIAGIVWESLIDHCAELYKRLGAGNRIAIKSALSKGNILFNLNMSNKQLSALSKTLETGVRSHFNEKAQMLEAAFLVDENKIHISFNQ